MSETNGAITKKDLMEMADLILRELGHRFNEVNIKLDSIDARLKQQAGLIQGGAQ